MEAKIIPKSDDDIENARMLELFINKEITPKIIMATALYGEKTLLYLHETNQLELLNDALEGKLDVSKLKE